MRSAIQNLSPQHHLKLRLSNFQIVAFCVYLMQHQHCCFTSPPPLPGQDSECAYKLFLHHLLFVMQPELLENKFRAL
jgi:hypothetical protein